MICYKIKSIALNLGMKYEKELPDNPPTNVDKGNVINSGVDSAIR